MISSMLLDLNYRVDINDAEIRKIIADKEWDNGLKVEALLRFDQVGVLPVSY